MMTANANLALLNRLHAALVDVPTGESPHFGRIAKALKVSPALITVGVWQLVNAGRLDRETLRPFNEVKVRSYCQHPLACAAHSSGACRLCPKPLTVASASPRPRDPTNGQGVPPPVRACAQVWCGQCDRRVPVAVAVKCQSRWCKAELPPHVEEIRACG